MFKKNHKPRPSAAIEEFNSSSDTVSLRAKLENERMSRRQALRKMGVMSGAAVLSLLTVDDLARLASKQLASSGGDSELATSVAKSLRSAGVVMANPNTTTDPNSPYWRVGDCGDRCVANALSHLGHNIPMDNFGDAGNVDIYCVNAHPYNANDYRHCVIEGYIPLSDPFIAAHIYAYSDCCKEECHQGREGTETCQTILRRPHPGTQQV